MTCTQTLTHIVGGAFSQSLSSSESPITEGGLPLADTTGWSVALEAVRDGAAPITIAGSWLSSVGPTWRMLFAQTATPTWQPGSYALRLKFTAPDTRVFRQPIELGLEVSR
jgi:hypothetical protein